MRILRYSTWVQLPSHYVDISHIINMELCVSNCPTILTVRLAGNIGASTQAPCRRTPKNSHRASIPGGPFFGVGLWPNSRVFHTTLTDSVQILGFQGCIYVDTHGMNFSFTLQAFELVTPPSFGGQFKLNAIVHYLFLLTFRMAVAASTSGRLISSTCCNQPLNIELSSSAWTPCLNNSLC